MFNPSMQASPALKQTKIEKEEEKEIESYIESLHLEDQYAQNPLVSPQMKKAQIREELKSAIQLPLLQEQIHAACTLLAHEGPHYMDNEIYMKLLNEFISIDETIDNLDLNADLTDDLQKTFNISDPVMEVILQMAKAKFQEEEYRNSLALFSLLTTLKPSSGDYWFRLGIAAQKSGDIALALRAYETAIELNPDLIGARLFSIECYLHNKDKEAAAKMLQEVKEVTANVELDEMWGDFLKKIENACN